MGWHGLGPQSFQALSCHGESLNELSLTLGKILKISLLTGCTNLVSVSLAAECTTDLAILETVAWLKKCEKLRSLTFKNFSGGAGWVAPIFLQNNIHLTSFKQNGFAVQNPQTLYTALANQTSLQSLWLTGDAHEWSRDPDLLTESLSKLVNLTYLCLRQLSDFFDDRHIIQLASKLTKLEVWSSSAEMLTDAIWGKVAALKSLRSLELGGSLRFTASGILDFIENLGPGNKGLRLSVTYVDSSPGPAWEHDIPEVEQILIHERIDKKVEGMFKMRTGNYWQY